jgi:hypothetical protein
VLKLKKSSLLSSKQKQNKIERRETDEKKGKENNTSPSEREEREKKPSHISFIILFPLNFVPIFL